jgi:hypothetical protein
MIRVLAFETQYSAAGVPTDWVHYTSGDAFSEAGQVTHSTWEKVSRLMPPASLANDDGGDKMNALRGQWQQIEPHYSAWKAGSEIPDDGTPLGAWPGVSSVQAEVLRKVGLNTVQKVAATPEAMLSRPPLPNMRELRSQALLWLESRDKAALEKQLAEQSEQIAAMMEMLAERETEKRGPGRPRKEAEAA